MNDFDFNIIDFDSSYYSSVRRLSNFEGYLFKSVIPISEVDGGERITAKAKGFVGYGNYTYSGSPDAVSETTFERPIGWFGEEMTTVLADEKGHFLKNVDIKFDIRNAYGPNLREPFKKMLIFVKSGTIEEIEIITESGGAPNYYIDDDVIVLTSEAQSLRNFTVVFKKTKPNEQLVLGGMFFVSDFYKITNKEIENAEILSSGDLTNGKISSEKLNLFLFEEKISQDYNKAVIRYIYNGNEKITKSNFRSFNIVDIKYEQKSELARTKVEAVDAMTFMNEDYSYQGFEVSGTDYELINNAIIQYNEEKKYAFVVQTEYITMFGSQGSTYYKTSPLYNSTYCSAIQSFSLFGAKVPRAINDIIYIFRPSLTYKVKNGIYFKELYSRPQIKEYPKLRKLSISFNNSKKDDLNKELLQENLEINISGNYKNSKLYFQNNYFVPENDASYILVDSEPINAEQFPYTVNGNEVVFKGSGVSTLINGISIYGNKIENSVFTISKDINEDGEDLNIEAKAYQYPTDHKHEITGGNLDAIFDEIPQGYELTTEVSLDLRGRFELSLFDVIDIEIRPNVFYKSIITEHKLTFDGSYKSKIKAFLIEQSDGSLLPYKNLYPANNILPREERII